MSRGKWAAGRSPPARSGGVGLGTCGRVEGNRSPSWPPENRVANALRTWLTHSSLVAAAAILVFSAKYWAPPWVYDLVEWTWVPAAVLASQVPEPSDLRLAVVLVGSVAPTCLLMLVVFHAGRALPRAVRRAKRPFDHRDAPQD